jgi:chemotaxis protein CheX
MPTELTAGILSSELSQIVESVFENMLGLQASERDTPWFPSGDRLTAVVQMAGEWNGAVLLECDRGQACRFAGRFLSMATFGEVDDVVRDVLGELANMISGNLKCVLTRGIRLSMPSVVDGSNYSVRVCKSEVGDRLAFHCAEGPFWITVLSTHP